MARILCGTDWISEDEKCFELYEQDLQSPDYSGFHRYRAYRVMRNGKITEFREDLGSVEGFRGSDQIVLLGGVIDQETKKLEILHTVGELREIADQYRNHIHFDKKELAQVDNIRLR